MGRLPWDAYKARIAVTDQEYLHAYAQITAPKPQAQAAVPPTGRMTVAEQPRLPAHGHKHELEAGM